MLSLLLLQKWRCAALFPLYIDFFELSDLLSVRLFIKYSIVCTVFSRDKIDARLINIADTDLGLVYRYFISLNTGIVCVGLYYRLFSLW